jgi:hypothetical protein
MRRPEFEVDEVNSRVRIRDRWFRMIDTWMTGGLFVVPCDLGSVKPIQDLKLGKLPENLVIEVSITSRLCKKPIFLLSLSRSEVKFEIKLSEEEWSLITPIRYFIDELAKVLMEVGEFSGTMSMDEGRKVYHLSCKLSFSSNQTIEDVISFLEPIVTSVSELVDAREQEYIELIDSWVSLLEKFDGLSIADSLKLYGAPRLIASKLCPVTLAYLLFRACRIIENNAVCEKILERLDIKKTNVEEYAQSILKNLGLIEVSKSDSRVTVSPTRAGEFLAKTIYSAINNIEVVGYSGRRPSIDPVMLLKHIRDNAMSYAAIHSPKIKKYRGSELYREKLLEFHEKVKKLNFMHIVALVNTSLEMTIPFELRNEEADLIENGFISENRRLRPYGRWIISVVKKYLRKRKAYFLILLAWPQKHSQSTHR